MWGRIQERDWTRWPTEVPSNTYHSVILWFLLSVSAITWMIMNDKGESELTYTEGLIGRLPTINPTTRTWPSWRGLWRNNCSLLWIHGLERMITMLQRQELKAAYWRQETMKISGCRFHRIKIIPKWEPWRRHLGVKCPLWELTSKAEEQGCRRAAVLIFRKGYEKHDRLYRKICTCRQILKSGCMGQP